MGETPKPFFSLPVNARRRILLDVRLVRRIKDLFRDFSGRRSYRFAGVLFRRTPMPSEAMNLM